MLARTAEFADVSFSVRRGEILGVYGLVGAGRSELMQSLFGLAPLEAGRIMIDGREVRIDDPQDAIRAGLGYVPEDRQHQGAILPFTIAANIALTNLGRLSDWGFSSRRRERRWRQAGSAICRSRRAGPPRSVGDLSGGNQQKVVLAKWLATAPKVLILDEPTKGIDVGAKAAVHAVMRRIRTPRTGCRHGVFGTAGSAWHVGPHPGHAARAGASAVRTERRHGGKNRRSGH